MKVPEWKRFEDKVGKALKAIEGWKVFTPVDTRAAGSVVTPQPSDFIVFPDRSPAIFVDAKRSKKKFNGDKTVEFSTMRPKQKQYAMRQAKSGRRRYILIIEAYTEGKVIVSEFYWDGGIQVMRFWFDTLKEAVRYVDSTQTSCD